MTISEAKKELKSYGMILREEKDTEEEIDRLKSRCTKVTATFSDMPSGGYNPKKLEDAIADLVDETEKYFKLLDKEKTIKAKIKYKLDKLEDINYDARVVLNKRYILLKSVYEIAYDLNISDRHAKRLLREAILEYSKL